MRRNLLQTGAIPRLCELTLSLLQPELTQRLPYADEVAHVLEEELSVSKRPALPVAKPYLCRPQLAGRGSLLSRLHEERICAAAGRGNLVLISGVSGVGKSRLLESHAQAARTDGLQVIIGHCGKLGHQDVEPLQGLRPFLRTIATQTKESDPTLTPLLRARAPLLAFFEPSLLRWCSDASQPKGPPSPPTASPTQIQASVLSLIHAFSAQQPTTLLFDDAQWADDLTLAVLRDFAHKPWIAPSCMVALSARSEQMPSPLAELRGSPRVQELRVSDLDRNAIRELATQVLGGSHIMDSWVDHLYARTAGNPLLVTSTLEHYLALGCLRRQSGRWIFDGEKLELGDDSISTEPVLRRVATVGGHAQRLLHSGSVLGRCFDLRLATEIANLDHEGVHLALQELRELRVLEHEGEWTFRFVHDQLLEAAYASMTTDVRRDLHRTAAFLLADRGLAAEVARHAKASEEHQIGFDYCMRAAKEAVAQGRYRQGTQYLQQAESHRASANRTLSGLERADIALLNIDITAALYDFAACASHARDGLVALGAVIPKSNIQWILRAFSGAFSYLKIRYLNHRNVPRSQEASPYWSFLGRFYYAIAGIMAYESGNPLAIVACSLEATSACERSSNSAWSARCTSVLALICGTARLRSWAENLFTRANFLAAEVEKTGDEATPLFCDSLEGLYYHFYSDSVAAQVAISRRLDVALAKGPSTELLQNLGVAAAICLGAGDIAASFKHVELLRDLSSLTEANEATAEGKIIELAILLQTGDFDRVITKGLATTSELEAKGSLVFQCAALVMSAIALAKRNRLDESAAAVAKVENLMPDTGSTTFTNVWVHMFYSEAFLQLAEHSHMTRERGNWLIKARRAVNAAFAFSRTVPRLRPKALYYNARLLALKNRRTAALRQATRALVLASRMQQPFERAQSLALIAAMRRRCGKSYQEAEQQALQLFEELGVSTHMTCD